MYDDVRTVDVVIAAGASLSAAGTCDGRLVAILTASTWDSAKVSLQASVDGTTYYVVQDESTGAEWATAAAHAAAAWVPAKMSLVYGARYLKVQSGTNGTAVNQADATTVTLVFWQV